MDDDESSLPNTINLNSFPAKLWRLVNDPTNEAIQWDDRGEGIFIDQELFQTQVLTPDTNTDIFKTTNFSSFIRQLNLYGFRKAIKDFDSCHYFYNPNFKRNHPKLVANLRRLTVDNKAKLKAGLDVKCRLPSRYQYLDVSGGGDDDDKIKKRKGSPSLQPTQLQQGHPHHPNKLQATKPQCGTPIPPRYLRRADAMSHGVLFPVQHVPFSMTHQNSGIASYSNSMQVQGGLLICENNRNPGIPRFLPRNARYQPGCYPTVCHCCHPNVVPPNVTGLQTKLFSPQSYFQAGYPMNMFDLNQELLHMENQEVEKPDINLDTIFQIADEVMQPPSNICPVKVAFPESPVTASERPPDHRDCVSRFRTTTPDPVGAAPAAVSSILPVFTDKEKDESVISKHQQAPAMLAVCTGQEMYAGLKLATHLKTSVWSKKSLSSGSVSDL